MIIITDRIMREAIRMISLQKIWNYDELDLVHLCKLMTIQISDTSSWWYDIRSGWWAEVAKKRMVDRKSHMCGKNHTCVEFITQPGSSKWLDKSTLVWEKPLSISISMKWQKPNMCGFHQTLAKYKGVYKTKHLCLFPNRWCYFLYLHLYLSLWHLM